MKRIIMMAVMMLAAPPVTAQDPMETLDTAYETAAWQGVGLLRIGRFGNCTAVLIAPDLVLTAAHCLYDDQSGQVVAPEALEFRAGQRFGASAAARGVQQVIAHQDYVHVPDGPAQVTGDIGILRLNGPIHSGNITPFDTGADLHVGDQASVVSFAHDRLDALSLQENCDVFDEVPGAVALTCDVDFGSSGAPVFRTGGATPVLVGIVSAKGEYEGNRVAYAASLGGALEDLLAEINAGFSTGQRSVTVGAGSSGSGRNFVSPD